jgi:hypothetical protein
LLQNQLAEGHELRTAIALERPCDQNSVRLTQFAPRSVWFELGHFAPVRWQPMLGWPMPMWSVSATNWPYNGDGQTTQPQIRLWWNPEKGVPLAATATRSAGRPRVSDFAGLILQAANESVRIESVRCENRFVTLNNGERSLQPCLVVELTHAVGGIYWAELVGMESAGVEREFYPSIGRTTCLFWPLTSDEVERNVTAIGLVSLAEWKKSAESRGFVVELKSPGRPDANDVLPTPAYPLDGPHGN